MSALEELSRMEFKNMMPEVLSKTASLPKLKVSLKAPLHTPEVELPSILDFQNAYLTDDISQARLHVNNILNHFMVTHCISVTKNAPIRLFVPMSELLETYGIEMKKATPVNKEICLFTFMMNPDKLPIFQT